MEVKEVITKTEYREIMTIVRREFNRSSLWQCGDDRRFKEMPLEEIIDILASSNEVYFLTCLAGLGYHFKKKQKQFSCVTLELMPETSTVLAAIQIKLKS